jgi:hypothetical protein
VRRKSWKRISGRPARWRCGQIVTQHIASLQWSDTRLGLRLTHSGLFQRFNCHRCKRFADATALLDRGFGVPKRYSAARSSRHMQTDTDNTFDEQTRAFPNSEDEVG